MKFRFWLAGALALSVAIAHHIQAIAHPALFSDMTLDEAKAQAKKDGKLLLVDFTAAWCPPCGEMDKTTWEDPTVVKWLKENAIALQIDVDKDKATSADLKITVMPSLVVFNGNDAEADRQLGYQSADELISWLTGVKGGVTSLEKMQKEFDAVAGKNSDQAVDARYSLARAQFDSGKYAASLENYVWLWQNMAKISPPMIGVRMSFLVSDIANLVEKSPEAKLRFGKLRDEAETTDLSDWVTLNQALDQDDRTLAWFEKVKNDSTQSAKLRRVSITVEPLLIKAGRWADAAVFFKEPMDALRKKYQLAQEIAKHSEEMAMNPFPRDAATIYACLLAAGRDAEAEKVAAESLKLQNTPEMKEELVFTAVEAGQLKPAVQARLDEINKTPASDGIIYFRRGVAYVKLKKFDQALDNFSKAIALSPTEPTYYDARESAYCELKQFDKAVADADHVLAIYPKSDRAFISRGFIHLKQKQDDLALKDFEQALQLNPNDPLSHINESAVYKRQGKFQLAFDAADKAVKLDSHNAGGFCNRGEAAYKLKKYEIALTDLSKSIEMGESLCGGENFYYRAKVYEALGKTDLANADTESAKKYGFVLESAEQ
jgi:tetratricopeptide (TPR) repeat protein